MKRFAPVVLGLMVGIWLLFSLSVEGAEHFWRLRSPVHEQTFAYGMEQSRVWREWPPDSHLALLLNYTNDPYVDRDNPRRYDNFRFDFPQIRLGKDGHTFYYHTSDGRSIPVAKKSPGFLGVNEVRLLPNATVIIDKPHGYITVTIEVADPGRN